MRREHYIQSGLPVEYRQVNYLSTSRNDSYTPYIDLNYYANNKTSAKIKHYITDNGTWLFGARTLVATGDAYGLCYNLTVASPTANIYPQFGNVSGNPWINPSTLRQQELVLEMSVNGAFVNGIQINNIAFNTNTWSCPYSMYLFQLNNRGVVNNGFKGRIYYCQIWNDGVLVRDMIPVIRIGDNKPGMWDLCGSICTLTGTSFYIKAGGTGDFNYA